MNQVQRDLQEARLEILSRAIASLIDVRSDLALGRQPDTNILDLGMTRSHLAEVLCFDLKHTERRGGGT